MHPADIEVAELLGIGTIIRGHASPDGRLVRVTAGSGVSFFAVSDVTGDVVATLQPEDVNISGAPFASSARNCLQGSVQEVVPCGSTVRVVLEVGFPMIALLTRESCGELGLVPGERVFATFKESDVHVFAAPNDRPRRDGALMGSATNLVVWDPRIVALPCGEQDDVRVVDEHHRCGPHRHR